MQHDSDIGHAVVPHLTLILVCKYGPGNVPTYEQSFHCSDMPFLDSLICEWPGPVARRLASILIFCTRDHIYTFLRSAYVGRIGIIQPFPAMHSA